MLNTGDNNLGLKKQLNFLVVNFSINYELNH